MICRDRDTGEESEETKPKNNRTCESAGGWVREGDESINTKPWKCFTLDTVMLSSHFTWRAQKCTHTDTHKLSRSHSSLQHSDSLFSRATHTTLTKQVNCFTHCFHKPHLKTSNVCCRFLFFFYAGLTGFLHIFQVLFKHFQSPFLSFSSTLPKIIKK